MSFMRPEVSTENVTEISISLPVSLVKTPERLGGLIQRASDALKRITVFESSISSAWLGIAAAIAPNNSAAAILFFMTPACK